MNDLSRESADKKPIVVGLDDSIVSRAALHWAAGHARLTGHPLLGVAVDSWSAMPGAVGWAPSDVLLPPVSDAAESYWKQAMQAVFEEVKPESGWALQTLTGDPRDVLVAKSRDALLLVVGTREHTGFGRLIAGSVSHFCISHAASPTVAVPAESMLRAPTQS